MPLAADVDCPPRYLWVPDHVTTRGGEAADLMALLGKPPDPEQRLALDAVLAQRADGRYAALTTVTIAPRQNVKTFMLLALALSDLFLFDARLITWTAHEFPAAMEGFREVDELIEAHPWLSRRVKTITRGNGDEGVELHSGQRLRFKARTLTGGRGLTGDRVLLDEGFALKPQHMGALLPTMSARSITGNPQMNIASSAGMERSEILRGYRDLGRPGGDPSLAYIEWCADEGGCTTKDCPHTYGIEGCALDDRERWRQANLATGRRISLEFMAAERSQLPAREFARERLGWWDEPADVAGTWLVVTEDQWLANLVPVDDDADTFMPEPSGWALDVAPDGRSAAIVASDGHGVEVVAYGPGSSWVVERLVDLAGRHDLGRVALDATGPASLLLDDMDDAGVPYRKVTLDEHAQACLQLLDAITHEECPHIGQEPLDEAVRVADRRSVTDRWLWTRARSSGDICPLVAAGLARFVAGQGTVVPLVAWR